MQKLLDEESRCFDKKKKKNTMNRNFHELRRTGGLLS